MTHHVVPIDLSSNLEIEQDQVYKQKIDSTDSISSIIIHEKFESPRV